MAIEKNKTHGMSETSTYHIWAAMKNRCTSPNDKYWDRYGGRGITICDRWQKFENFYADMGGRPEGKQLDRIDNNKGYFPDNCRWATPRENASNQERSVRIEMGYIRLSLSDLAELGNVSRPTIKGRWRKYGNVWNCLFPPS
jgi:hypothetical protein